jgi:integrase
LLIFIAAYSGLRQEEICQLRIGTDVDRKKMIVQAGKTESARRLVPVHQELENLIDHLCSTSKDSWLIPSLKSGNKYGKRSHNIGQRFGDLKTDLGFPKREDNFHSFRHSCSTTLREASVEDYWIQQIIGHKTGRLAGVPGSTVTDQYTFSPQDFESKNYDTKKPILIKSDTKDFGMLVALISNRSSVIEI